MENFFGQDIYWTVTWTMVALAVVVFIALQWIEAPYGMAFRKGWGPSLNNRVGWIVMEAPAFVAMLAVTLMSPWRGWWTMTVAAFFLFHYFQRSFVFPLLMRGKSRMPWLIALMGATFNTVNVYLIGGWLYYIAPADYYADIERFFGGEFTLMFSTITPFAAFLGILIFIAGMAINWNSDYIIRHLRRPGETGHKIPYGGMYNYVSSANYLGEIVEWIGFALMSWSMAGVVFVMWTCANLVPRSAKIHQRYINEFGEKYTMLNRRKIFPFIY
jgi:3-oxo-5-alpha-steroid 4-dehydrogenase 1